MPDNEKKTKYKDESTEAFGTDYLIPKNLKRRQFLKLVETWEQKLQSAGHNDIEIRLDTGRILPFFKRPEGVFTSNSSSPMIIKQIKPDVAEYYRLCRTFLTHANFKQLFPRDYVRIKYAFSLHTDGVSYRKLGRAMAKSAVPKRYRGLKTERWAHWILQPVIREMYRWHRTDPEGLLLPEEPDDAA